MDVAARVMRTRPEGERMREAVAADEAAGQPRSSRLWGRDRWTRPHREWSGGECRCVRGQWGRRGMSGIRCRRLGHGMAANNVASVNVVALGWRRSRGPPP